MIDYCLETFVIDERNLVKSMFISEKINHCDSYNKILQRSNKVIVTKKLFFDSEKLASDKDKPLLSSIADFVL